MEKDPSLTGKLGAIRMAEIIGCSGAHQDKNGKWNPCASPEELDRISNAAEPTRRKTALSEVEDWQKSRTIKGKKKKKEWLRLGQRGVYGIETSQDGGLTRITTPSGVGSGVQSSSMGKAAYESIEEKGVNPFSPRDNDVDVFSDIESARARSRQLGCIGVSRRVSKTGRTVWMPCTNMTDYSRLSGTTALGRRHQQEALTRRIRTVVRDDLTKLRRKKSLFEEINGFIPLVKEAILGGTTATGVDMNGKKKKGTKRGPKNDQNSIRQAMEDAVKGKYKSDESGSMSDNESFIESTRSFNKLPDFINPCEPGYAPTGKRRNRHGKMSNGCVKIGSKSLGRRILNNVNARFDPNAIDADGDMIVQEGTPFERPATPRARIQTPAVAKPQAPGMPSTTGGEDPMKDHLKRMKRKAHLDWAYANPSFNALRPIVDKHKKDKESLTDKDYEKLERFYNNYGPGKGRGSRSTRGMRSERYVGKPNVGGKEMGKIILGRVKPQFRNKKSGEKRHFAIAGAPGMGKSTLVDYLQKRGLIPKNDEAAHVDPDFIKQGLVGYAGGRGAGAVHYESANSATRVVDDAVGGGMDIITEGTGQRMRYYRSIRDRGYSNIGHWAFTPTDTAIQRLRARRAEDGRSIAEEITTNVHSSTYGLVNGYLNDGTLDEFTLWNTDVPKGSDPKKIVEVIGGVAKFYDEDKFVQWAEGGLGRSGKENLSYWQRRFSKNQ